MIYLSQMLGTPVLDSNGESIGVVNDLGIATGEVFPRVTSLAFQGPERTPFMISWRKYVDAFSVDEVRLKVPSTDIRFSYLQPDEVLIARDLLNKQIVDTRGMKVVRVNDLKLSDTGSSLRLLGAEVGMRGILRSLSPRLERLALRVSKTFGKSIPEQVIAWNYMDLLDRDLSDVKLSVSHKTLDELHPADIADIIEQLDPRLRAQVFAQLDHAQAAEAMAEIDDDEVAARIMDEMAEDVAATMLSQMDPDDAADLVSELGHDKAEKLLRLMGFKERKAINQLLGYREDTAGRIMTSEFLALSEEQSVGDAIERISQLDEDFESVRYVYTVDSDRRVAGVVTLRQIIVCDDSTKLADIAHEATITANPDDDQEDVAEEIAKYNLMAVPVVDDDRHILGIVTVDDALDVMEEEHEEDLQIAGGTSNSGASDESSHLLRRMLSDEMWAFFWIAGLAALPVCFGAAGAPALRGLIAAAAMPIALHGTDTMVRYVTNFFLEFDADDEDAPSLLGFALRGIGVAAVYSVVVLLLATGISSLLHTGTAILVSAGEMLFAGFRTSVVVVVVAFALAPLYLVALRHRDARDLDTSGIALRAVALAVSTALFVGLALCGLVLMG